LANVRLAQKEENARRKVKEIGKKILHTYSCKK